MKKSQIAFREAFTMYVYVSFKVADAIHEALIKGGFKAENKNTSISGDDHEISVTVMPANAYLAVNIIEHYL